MRMIFVLFTLFMVIGCGSSAKHAEQPNQLDKTSKAYFGALSDAKIEIYEIANGKKLLFRELTSSGDSLGDIGNFNAHIEQFDKSKFYQFQLKGGKNWDKDKDGKKDKTFTPNSKIYRAIYKGKQPHVAWWSIQTKGNSKKISE